MILVVVVCCGLRLFMGFKGGVATTMTLLYFMGLFFFFFSWWFFGLWVDLILLWVSKVVVVTIGGWERERERQIWTSQTQFWVFRSKPSFEIVHAIKASNCSFVWVVGKTFICRREFVMVCLAMITLPLAEQFLKFLHF